MRFVTILTVSIAAQIFWGHDGHGRSTAPAETHQWKNPVERSDGNIAAGRDHYLAHCVGCHGDDGRSRANIAGKLPVRPTDLANHVMESMKDGEIFWVEGNGSGNRMPAFGAKLSGTARWQVANYVRELRVRRRAAEKSLLGSYEWKLPPGFPSPNVPADNPMTQVMVDLGGGFSTISGCRRMKPSPARPVTGRIARLPTGADGGSGRLASCIRAGR